MESFLELLIYGFTRLRFKQSVTDINGVIINFSNDLFDYFTVNNTKCVSFDNYKQIVYNLCKDNRPIFVFGNNIINYDLYGTNVILKWTLLTNSTPHSRMCFGICNTEKTQLCMWNPQYCEMLVDSFDNYYEGYNKPLENLYQNGKIIIQCNLRNNSICFDYLYNDINKFHGKEIPFMFFNYKNIRLCIIMDTKYDIVQLLSFELLH